MTQDGLNKEFSKHIIIPAEDDTFVFIHYLGYEELSVEWKQYFKYQGIYKNSSISIKEYKDIKDKEPSVV